MNPQGMVIAGSPVMFPRNVLPPRKAGDVEPAFTSLRAARSSSSFDATVVEPGTAMTSQLSKTRAISFWRSVRTRSALM